MDKVKIIKVVIILLISFIVLFLVKPAIVTFLWFLLVGWDIGQHIKKEDHDER